VISLYIGPLMEAHFDSFEKMKWTSFGLLFLKQFFLHFYIKNYKIGHIVGIVRFLKVFEIDTLDFQIKLR
jgi:hypothetical protein